MSAAALGDGVAGAFAALDTDGAAVDGVDVGGGAPIGPGFEQATTSAAVDSDAERRSRRAALPRIPLRRARAAGPSMTLLLLEALGALLLLLFIVWWTMFAGRRRGERRDDPPE